MSRSLREQITRKVNSYIPLTEKDETSKMLVDELVEIVKKKCIFRLASESF